MTSPPSNRLDAFAAFLIRYRLWLLGLGILATLAAIGPSQRLTFDQTIESLYADDDPHLLRYKRSKFHFGGDEFVFVAYTDPNLYSLNAQDRLIELAEQLREIPGVRPTSVQNLASQLRAARLLAVIPQGKVKALVRKVLVGDDDQTTAVVLRLEPADQSPVPRDQTILAIREVARKFTKQHPTLTTFVVGEPIHIQEMFRYVEQDGLWLWVYSALLLFVVILLVFRSLRWTLLPVAVCIASVLWTRALLVATGMQLSMVSSMLNSLLTIVSVATVVLIAVEFRDRRRGLARVPALQVTFAILAMPIFWNAATTALGFGAVMTTDVQPVQSFGIMMTLGSLLVLPAMVAFIPGGALIGELDAEPQPAPAEGRLQWLLELFTQLVERRPGQLAAATLLFAVISLAGLLFLRVETDFSKNFRDSSPIVRGLNFVESRLGGAGTWEVNFPAPEEITPEYLETVRTLAKELRSIPQADGTPVHAISLADGIDLIPTLPFVSGTLNQKLGMLSRFQPEFTTSLYDAEGGRMRIVLRAKERQPSETKLALIAAVEGTARKHFPEAEATGLFVLLTFLIESLLGDQISSFAISAVGIWLMMSIAFRSTWIGLISLVPNVFPIIVVIGTMGWTGMPINIATAMISSVSMGLTVDASIHYLAAYERERKTGATFGQAVRETNRGVGSALVLATVALMLGFFVLTASHFVPLVYFGLLVGVAMFGGLIGNLLLLPLMLSIGQPRTTPAVPSPPPSATESQPPTSPGLMPPVTPPLATGIEILAPVAALEIGAEGAEEEATETKTAEKQAEPESTATPAPAETVAEIPAIENVAGGDKDAAKAEPAGDL